MTNYEYMKNMSIEEMGMADIKCDKEDSCNCVKCCFEWLKQEI